MAEQVASLKNRGMQLDDAFALDTLSKVSYFRLKPYWWDMRDLETDEDFLPDSNFSLAIQRYNSDRELRLILFEAIEGIYEYFGLEFYLYLNDHEPVHVHVKHDKQETVFELNPDSITIRKNVSKQRALNKNDKRKAKRFINVFKDHIISKWESVHDNKEVQCEIITKQIKGNTSKLPTQ